MQKECSRSSAWLGLSRCRDDAQTRVPATVPLPCSLGLWQVLTPDADTCGLQQDSLASEVAWLKWKDAHPPRQADEVTYGPTIFGDDMGVRAQSASAATVFRRVCEAAVAITCAHAQAIRMEVENEGKEHAHQVS